MGPRSHSRLRSGVVASPEPARYVDALFANCRLYRSRCCTAAARLHARARTQRKSRLLRQETSGERNDHGVGHARHRLRSLPRCRQRRMSLFNAGQSVQQIRTSIDRKYASHFRRPHARHGLSCALTQNAAYNCRRGGRLETRPHRHRAPRSRVSSRPCTKASTSERSVDFRTPATERHSPPIRI